MPSPPRARRRRVANAKTAKDTADAAVTAAQQKVDEAQAKLDTADAQLKQGAIASSVPWVPKMQSTSS